MPSRKQRRRRLKDRRHDMEYVWLDEEGNEIDADEAPQPSRNGSAATATKARSGAKEKPIQTGRRVVQPPSWHRATRRGLLFAPVIALFVYLLNRNVPPAGIVLNVLVLLAFFIPFGYLMDRITYRAYTRRLNAQKQKKRA